MVFLVENGKREHYHWILDIRISLGTKFQLKTDNFDILDQTCPEKDISGLEQKNRTLACVHGCYLV